MDTNATRRGFVKATAAGAAALAGLNAYRVASASADEAAMRVGGNDLFSGKANARQLTDDLWWVGASDKRIALFENVYPLDQGVAYNSYILLDEATVLVDTVDRSVWGQYFENVYAVLDGRDLDYLIVNHMEPDHASAISQVLTNFPNATVVTTEKAKVMIQQFFDIDISDRELIVAEGDTLTTGAHTLAFVEAPMVHWPEVMVTYDATTATLFSADAFGSFNALDGNIFADQVNFQEAWLDEARRYYCNIVGKYGPQVQDVLAKAGTLDIRLVCATHGPMWRQDLGWILDKYSKWSSYTPEDQAVVVFYGSIYGGTENAANILASQISQAGVDNVKVYDVSKTHVSYLIAEAFRASHLVFASVTYNMNVFTPMKNFLNDLVAHNMQNRYVSFVQNGSWSPASGEAMQAIVGQMTDMIQVGDLVTLRSTTSEENVGELKALAEAIAASVADYVAPRDAAAAEPAAEGEAAAEGVVTTKWRCTICGAEVEVEVEELPADFKCPICGQGPEVFEKVEE